MGSRESVVRKLRSADASDTIVHEYDAATPASIAVIHAICAVSDVDPIEAPTELGFVLHEHINPDALDTLLGDGTGDGETVITFKISNERPYTVDISDDGRIEVQRSSAPR
ncbi:HalOD1 output domain-containing protein [Natronorubrum sp. FCH18a]|uniref:HalOD1 output domain-containing protein n=1 Tax=Natronorubrum sp. FCH18a TaxID=3447018 RepID=UPI003F511ACC